MSAGSRRAACKVLLVEDHADTAFVLARLLEKLGYTVDTAHSAAEARAKFGTGSPDVLIIDLLLPDGTGTDLLKELRARRPIRAIAFSALGMEADIQRSRAAGFDAHLTKPATVIELDAAIREACESPN